MSGSCERALRLIATEKLTPDWGDTLFQPANIPLFFEVITILSHFFNKIHFLRGNSGREFWSSRLESGGIRVLHSDFLPTLRKKVMSQFDCCAGRRFLRKDEELLYRANACEASLRQFRAERERCKRFTYGDQWGDYIEDCGRRMTEEEYIRSQGNFPLKNNLIRRLVRNVLGVFRGKLKVPGIQTTDVGNLGEANFINRMLKENAEANRLVELYTRGMEEFLISGLVVHKKWYGRRGRRLGTITDHVSPAKFFFDTSARDIRGTDVSILGETHDMAFDELCATFAHRPSDIEELARLYGIGADNRGRCRVTEVWERRRLMRLNCHDLREGRWIKLDADRAQAVERLNSLRKSRGEAGVITDWVFDEVWTYTFLAPDSTILNRGESPYPGGRHPYVFKAYPYIDGEIHSFVSDIIDQQKLTNRLISMYDWILRASAKGVLLFPEGSLPDGVDINDVADEWGRFNGVIVYRPRPGVELPQQVSSKATDIGITELLEIQMRMMEDVSGVNGALQGKLENGSMSGTLYSQQTANSMSALADLMGSYEEFMREATEVDTALLLAYKGISNNF